MESSLTVSVRFSLHTNTGKKQPIEKPGTKYALGNSAHQNMDTEAKFEILFR